MKKILGIIAIAVLFTGCSNDSKELKLVVNKTNGIDITCASKSDSEVVCLLKNTGDKKIDLLNLYVAAYDKNNKLVSTVSGTAQAVNAGKETVITANYNNTGNLKDFSKIEIVAQPAYINDISEIVNNAADIKVTYNQEKNSEAINVKVENTKGVSLGSVSVSLLFYKNNKLVGSQDAYYETQEAVASEIVSAPYKENKKVEYDTIKTVVNFARN